jgi:hypothetical protein
MTTLGFCIQLHDRKRIWTFVDLEVLEEVVVPVEIFFT